jgi:hypothetical protein
MSYASIQSSMSRTKIMYIEMDLDYCANTFGVAPCTATGVKCYNTFGTCKDKPHYSKTVKTYKFISHGLPADIQRAYAPALPYINGKDDISTELKATTTVNRRMNITFFDDANFNDVGTDPYRGTRTTIQGSFFKKLIARNKNYKGRKLRYYEGYAGLPLNEFKLKFSGVIENIKIKGATVDVEAVDLLKAMSDIEYPLKTSIALAQFVPSMFTANSDSSMTSLEAYLDDICKRQDFLPLTYSSATVQSNEAGGTLVPGSTYTWYIVAYDGYGRPIARTVESSFLIGTGYNAITFRWNAVTNANTYRIYRTTPAGVTTYRPVDSSTLTFLDLGPNFLDTAGTVPTEATRYFALTGSSPELVDAWTANYGDITIILGDASALDASGYIQIDKEIIYYSAISSNTLTGVERGQHGTDSSATHDAGTVVYALLQYTPGNPFAHLKDMLTKAGLITYAHSSFTTYEDDWEGINFSLRAVAKSTKLSNIFFDLVNVLDCYCWENEDGLIEIRKHSEIPETIPELSDDYNFIKGSTSVDLNEASRVTRCLLYWNRTDLTKGLTESDAYNHYTVIVDADSEGTEYLDKIEDVQYTAWLNDDSNTGTDTQDYISALLSARLTRTRDSQSFFEGEIEQKDDSIRIGDVVGISTGQLQDIDGADYDNVLFRIVKKKSGKIKAQLKL